MKRRVVVAAVLVAAACASGEERRGDRVWDPMAATMQVQVTPWSVRMLFHVTNAGEEPVRLTFPTAQRYDIVVTTAEGEEVWRWSEGRSFAQVVTRGRLAPGETWQMTGTWEHGSRSGAYRATGILGSRQRPIRKTAHFEIP